VSITAESKSALAELVNRVAAVTAEHAERTDTDATFPVEALQELRETRLLGLLARIIHRTARNRPRPPNTWARDFIAKNFIKQSIRIIVSDSNGLALIAHFS